MKMRKNPYINARYLVSGLLPLILLALSACSNDDPVIPPDPPTTGFIRLATQPDSLPAPWSLMGPDDWSLSGTGVDTLIDLAPGTYSCTWTDFEGWMRPDPFVQIATMAAGDTIFFLGSYEEVLPTWDTWVTIPAGTFLMGASDGEDTALRNERPQHQVTLTRSYLIQATEVTNAQYLEMAQWALDQQLVTATEEGLWDNLDGSSDLLMDFSNIIGGQPWCEIEYRFGALQLRDIGFGLNPEHPVKMVTWYGAAAYCDWKSLREGLDRAYDHSDWSCGGGVPYSAAGYRLPTEAEWEYACRAGTTTPFYSGEITNPWGTPEPALEGVAWYQGNSVDWTHPVAQLQPNAWGLFDMHGNLFKWVNGFEYVYSAEPVDDPFSPRTSGNRVAKGGAWTRSSHYHRVAFRRMRETLDYRGPKQGFRPVRTLDN